MRSEEVLLNPAEVDHQRGRGRAIRLAVNFAAEGMVM